ncbi:molybdopterin dinucleotide binding domain-containing protein [Paenibacillus koleovorans]|uniref:molybdopterin dinucleotide binding domain-containing protein n=1 Tax=Paenibacillus koleovorans TaxID=121608 RepID=UPI001FE9CEBF|nr:molybdopterin dinucleotide binding domain-containing protein [Paenibacillus koleovorans]
MHETIAAYRNCSTPSVETAAALDTYKLYASIIITDSIHPTTWFVPFHWDGDWSVNRLTDDALHPAVGNCGIQICAVRVERVDEFD